MSEERTIEYKHVKIPWPHCPVCNERASGNGSGILPHRCACGEWEYVTPGTFTIKKQDDE